MKRYWEVVENYHTQKLSLEDGHVLYTNWFDSGKNPSKEKWSFEDILNGKHDYFILMELKPWFLKEIKGSINELLSQSKD